MNNRDRLEEMAAVILVGLLQLPKYAERSEEAVQAAIDYAEAIHAEACDRYPRGVPED